MADKNQKRVEQFVTAREDAIRDVFRVADWPCGYERPALVPFGSGTESWYRVKFGGMEFSGDEAAAIGAALLAMGSIVEDR